MQNPVDPWEPERSTRAALHLCGVYVTPIEGSVTSCTVTLVSQISTRACGKEHAMLTSGF